MSYPEIEEFASEDIGFQLATGKHGVQLFKNPVDFENVATSPLHLLSVGNTKKIYAVSNTTLVAVGHLLDLNSPDSIRLSLHTVDVPSLTCLSLNSSNDTLYGVSASNVVSMLVADIEAGNSKVTQVTDSGDVSTMAASPCSPLLYFFLKVDKSLIIVHGEESTIPAINAAAWSILGTTVGAVTDFEFSVFDVHGKLLVSHEFSDVELKDVSCVDSNNWFILATESEEDVYYLVNVELNTIKNVSSVALAPPFGDAERAHSLYSTSLVNWTAGTSYAFITSALSTDIATVECGNGSKLVTQLNDTDRAELPMDDDSGDDTLPVGFAIDVSATDLTVKEPCQGVEEAVGVLPRLLCLNNLGNLLIWYVFDTTGVKKGTVSLTRALEAITPAQSKTSSSGASEEKNSEITSTAKEEPKQAFGSTSFGQLSFGSRPSETSGFGSSGFGQPSLAQSSQESSGPEKPSGFGSGFGSSGFGSSSLGSSGFGKSSFGSKKEDSNSTSSGAGSTGFGGATFGQTSFGNKPTFGSSGFGATSGSSASSKPSNFGSFSSSSFSSTKTGQSPFGETQPPSGSPFGAVKASIDSPFGSKASTNSPFGNIGGSEPSPFGSARTSTASPFESTKPAPSPFGTMKPVPSPFGSTKPADSPFGSTEPAPSPFGTMKPVPSPFGSTKPSSSPFGALQQQKTNKESTPESSGDLFGPSSFGKLDLSEKSDDAPKTSLFGSGVAVKDENSEHSTINAEDTKATKETEDKESFSLPALGSNQVKSEPSAFEKLKSQEPGESVNSRNSSDELGTEEDSGVNRSESEASLSEAERTKNERSQQEKTETTKSQPLSVSKSDVEVPGADVKESKTEQISLKTKQAPVEKSSEGWKESILKIPEKVQNMSQNTTADQKLNVLNPDSSGLTDEVADSESDDQFRNDENKPDNEVQSVIDFQPLSLFAGWTSSPKRTNNKITNEILELLESSHANMTVLELNALSIQELIENCDFNDYVYGMEELEYPEIWTLGAVEDVTDIAYEVNSKVEESLVNARAQYKSLSRLMGVVEKCDSLKEQLSRIISQIAMFKQELDSPKTYNRPLDIKSQTLCYKLRKNFDNVQKNHELALEKIVQLKMKQQVDRDFVKKVEQVVFEIHAKSKLYREQFQELEVLLDNASEPSKTLSSPQSSGVITNFKSQKWRFASKFANPTVKKVNIDQI